MSRQCHRGCPGAFSVARWFFLLTLAFAAALSRVTDQGAAQTERAVEWERFDVTLELLTDGSYRVTERQVVEFDGGPFRTGFADIPLTNVEDIGGFGSARRSTAQIQPFEPVAEDDYDAEPETFTYVVTSTEVKLDYAFEPAVRRDAGLRHPVRGDRRVARLPGGPAGPGGEQIRWTAIDAEVTEVAPVRRVDLHDRPAGAGPARPSPAGRRRSRRRTPSTTRTAPRRSHRRRVSPRTARPLSLRKGDLDAGDGFEVWLQFPAIVNVAPPQPGRSEPTNRRPRRTSKRNVRPCST